MENSNLENDAEVRLQNIQNFAGYVAPFVLNCQITDHNYSPSNGLSGLDQVTEFYVGKYIDDNIFNHEFVKAKITEEIAYLRFDEDLINNQSIEDIEEYYAQKGFFCYEDDLYYEDDIEATYYTLDEPEFKKMVQSIATGYARGIYTIDNPSRINGKNGLQQVLFFAARLLYSESLTEDLIYDAIVEKRFKAHLLALRGGSNLADLTIEDLRDSTV